MGRNPFKRVSQLFPKHDQPSEEDDIEKNKKKQKVQEGFYSPTYIKTNLMVNNRKASLTLYDPRTKSGVVSLIDENTRKIRQREVRDCEEIQYPESESEPSLTICKIGNRFSRYR